ncbi:Riean_0653 family protein [Flaviaesturariibacter terrae]
MKNLIVLGGGLFFLASCSKKPGDLPEASATGANTFGARVNGELWAPQAKGIIPHAPLLEASFTGTDSYIIHARNFSKSPTETEFEIYLQGVTAPGTYQLNSNTALYPGPTASYAYFVERTVMPAHEWMTTTQTGGTVVITKVDKVNHILAGTFSFRGTDKSSSGGVLDVTEGRFDVAIQ